MNRRILVIIVILLLPSIVFADSGLPYLFGWGFQVLILTFLVGLVESFALRKITNLDNKTSRIVIGNYVSTVVGQAFVAKALYEYLDLYKYIPIPKRLGPFTDIEIGELAIAFILTLIIEYPFIRWSLSKENRNRKTILKGVFLVNIISYALIILYYLWALDWMYYN